MQSSYRRAVSSMVGWRVETLLRANIFEQKRNSTPYADETHFVNDINNIDPQKMANVAGKKVNTFVNKKDLIESDQHVAELTDQIMKTPNKQTMIGTEIVGTRGKTQLVGLTPNGMPLFKIEPNPQNPIKVREGNNKFFVQNLIVGGDIKNPKSQGIAHFHGRTAK